MRQLPRILRHATDAASEGNDKRAIVDRICQNLGLLRPSTVVEVHEIVEKPSKEPSVLGQGRLQIEGKTRGVREENTSELPVIEIAKFIVEAHSDDQGVLADVATMTAVACSNAVFPGRVRTAEGKKAHSDPSVQVGGIENL